VKIRHDDGDGDPTFSYDLRITDSTMSTPAPTSGTCDDSSEPDDSAAQAQPLALYEAQTHAFCVAGDADWLAFTAEAGTTYQIATYNLAPDVDTVLEVYASDGSTLLEQNDDYYGDASQVTFNPTTSGTYYLKVRHANANWGDPSYTYELWMTEDYGGW